MYAIGINDDNTISTLVNHQICEGYKLSDWFWIFVRPYYNGDTMQKYTAFIEYTLPKSKKVIVEKLSSKDEKYKNVLKYSLLSTSHFTKEYGVVAANIIFKDDKETMVRKTSTFFVKISISEKWHNDIQNNSDSSSGNKPSENECGCLKESMEQILSKTRPLVFDSVSDAENNLNSGEIEDIYLGQPVIINKDGKYISYTVQKNGNEYTVEPVDTVCNGDNLTWQEG